MFSFSFENLYYSCFLMTVLIWSLKQETAECSYLFSCVRGTSFCSLSRVDVSDLDCHTYPLQLAERTKIQQSCLLFFFCTKSCCSFAVNWGKGDAGSVRLPIHLIVTDSCALLFFFLLSSVLQLKLQQRRTREELATQGMMPREYRFWQQMLTFTSY